MPTAKSPAFMEMPFKILRASSKRVKRVKHSNDRLVSQQSLEFIVLLLLISYVISNQWPEILFLCITHSGKTGWTKSLIKTIP